MASTSIPIGSGTNASLPPPEPETKTHRDGINKKLLIGALVLIGLVAIAVAIAVPVSRSRQSNSVVTENESPLVASGQRCLQTQGRHKPSPSKEGLFDCHMYSENSCCTHETTRTLVDSSANHIGPFIWEKCEGVSPQCEEFIKNEMCFYYCSPNTYPWAEKILTSTEVHPEDVGETYSKVPICSSYCDQFFEACKDQPICVSNWYTDWDVHVNHTTGQTESHCKADSTCATFGERFEDGAAMCNGIFGDSYVSTPGTPGEDCLVMSFSDASNNPNDAVATRFSN